MCLLAAGGLWSELRLRCGELSHDHEFDRRSMHFQRSSSGISLHWRLPVIALLGVSHAVSDAVSSRAHWPAVV